MHETHLRSQTEVFPAGTLPSAARGAPALHEHLAELRNGDPESPLCKLYERSRTQPAQHHEGAAWRGAIRGVLDVLRAEGCARVDVQSMEARMCFMEDLSRRALDELQGIRANRSGFYPEMGKVDVPAHAMVFFGSFVRGKPEPGDIDARIVIPYFTPYWVDTFMMGFNESQSAMSAAWRRSETLPKEYREGDRAIKIALEVDSHYGEGNGLEFVEKCPYVAFVRVGGEVHPFVNSGGTGYLGYRAP